MSSVARETSRVHPAIRPGLDRLHAFLVTEGYHPHSTRCILEHVACHETLAGTVELELLDPKDLDVATEAFVQGLPEVPMVSPEWGSPTGDGSLWNPLDDRWERGGGEPTVADRQDLDAWLSQIDNVPAPEDQAEEVHQWYDSRPSFSAWLDSQGGPRSSRRNGERQSHHGRKPWPH
jgi:hypothetical protein